MVKIEEMNSHKGSNSLKGSARLELMRKLRYTRLHVLLALGLLPATTLMATGKLSADLARIEAGGVVDVIVQFKDPPSGADHAAIAMSGGRLKKTFPHLRGSLHTVPVGALNDILTNPNVVYISPDRKLSGALE